MCKYHFIKSITDRFDNFERLKAVTTREKRKDEVDGVILSADSIIYIDDKKLEKPKTKEQAKIMLQNLSGRVNYAVTRVTNIDLYQNKKNRY